MQSGISRSATPAFTLLIINPSAVHGTHPRPPLASSRPPQPLLRVGEARRPHWVHSLWQQGKTPRPAGSTLTAIVSMYIYSLFAAPILLRFNLLQARKAEFLLADAVERGCDCIVTFGSLHSNHARVMSIAARELGLDAVLFIRGGTPLVSSMQLDQQLNRQLTHTHASLAVTS